MKHSYVSVLLSLLSIPLETYAVIHTVYDHAMVYVDGNGAVVASTAPPPAATSAPPAPTSAGPGNPSPVNPSPVNQSPVNQSPVSASPVNQLPVNASPVGAGASPAPSSNTTSSGGGNVFNVEFTGAVGLYYFMTGAGGTQLDKFTQSPQSFQITGTDAGMGIEIGKSDPSAGKGNSKFECSFPSSPSKDKKPFCNMSYVDGYSVGLNCKLSNGANWENAGGKTTGAPSIGHGGDLFSLGNKCTKYNSQRFLCPNNGADMSITGAQGVQDPAFFSPADAPANPSGSEVFWNSINAYPYDPTGMPTIQCTVTVPTYPSAKRDLSGAAEENATVAERDVEHVHRHAEVHMKQARRHARSLRNVIGKATA